jgi:hypothetical protein
MIGKAKHKAHRSDQETNSGDFCIELPKVVADVRIIGQGEYGPIYENTYHCSTHGETWKERMPE